MKRVLILWLITIFIFTGCSYKENKDIVSTPISDNSYNGEGVIAPMSSEELTKKLSQINKDTTKTGLVLIFGKEPFMPIELNSNIYKYFCGDIDITFWGDPIFQGTVSCGESSFAIELNAFGETELSSMKVAIFTTGGYGNSYLFTIDSKGTLYAAYGPITTAYDIENDQYINVNKKAKIELTEEQQERLASLEAEIEKTSIGEKVLLKDGREVLISINNKKYNFNYGEYENECFGKIVNELIKISPLKVDFNVWS